MVQIVVYIMVLSHANASPSSIQNVLFSPSLVRFSDKYTEYGAGEGDYVLDGCTTMKTVSEGGGGEYGTIECWCDFPNREFVAVQSEKYSGSNEGERKDFEKDKTLSKANSTVISISVMAIAFLGLVLKI